MSTIYRIYVATDKLQKTFSKFISKTFGDKKKVLTFAATFLTER